MAHYLFEVSYTPESWAAQVRTQANVIERITPLVQACEGQLEKIFYAFGETDLVALIEFPTPEDAAAFSLAAAAGGALRSIKTIALLEVEQGITAMSKAAAAASVYSPPTSIDLTAGAKEGAQSSR